MRVSSWKSVVTGHSQESAHRTDQTAEICALDDAPTALAQIEPWHAQVLERRSFGGLTAEEPGDAVGVSPQTVMCDWLLGRLWLASELRKL